MSKFSTLYTAVSGLNAAQANLYVTGHNMSNVNTSGYTRQQVIQVDHYYNNIGKNHSGVMQLGLGTNVSAIRQIRDKFLDKAYRSSASTLGFYNVAYNVGSDVELTIGEMEGEYKMQSVLRDLRNSLSELGNDPRGVDTRGDFISTCIVFVDKANDTYKNLRNRQDELNDEIKKMTKRVNELLDDICKYSKLINSNELAGDNANDYRDAINSALDELSSYLDIDYTIKGDYTVNIFCEGSALITNNVASHLGLRYCSTNTNLVEIVLTNRTDTLKYDEDARLLFNYDRDVSAKNGNDGGALKGLVVARGLSYVSYVDTPELITERYQNDKSALDPMDPDYNKKLRLLDLQYQRDMFNINNCIIPQAQQKLDTLVHGIVTLINDTFAPLVETSPGSGVYEKNPDYPYGLDGSQEYMPIFVRNGSSYQYDSATGEITGEDMTDYYSLFTIGNFTINPALRNASNYKLMTLSPSGDVSDNSSIMELLGKWDKSFMGIDNLSVDSYYRQIISDLSIDINRSKKISESEHEIIQQNENDRLMISGVSLDEEMTNMLKFQHAYNAAARLLNYVDSMLERIINGTGRVGL